jgi:thioredoxin-like negative regulator of GroEL
MISMIPRHLRILTLPVLLSLLAAGCSAEPPAGVVVDVSKDNFRSVVIRSKRPVVLEFWSLNCDTCKGLEPHLAGLARKHEGLLVAKINSLENEEIASEYGVRLVPTVFILQDGDIIRRQVSPKPEELADLVAPYVSSK